MSRVPSIIARCLVGVLFLSSLVVSAVSAGAQMVPATQAAADRATTAAPGTASTLVGWGNGTLGDGRVGFSAMPRPVKTDGALAGRTITALSTGGFQACAIADSQLFCWSRTDEPKAMAGALSAKKVTAVAVGSLHTCAVANGAAYCWGSNYAGQLGDGSLTDSADPVAVSTAGFPAGQAVTAVSSGSDFSCAVAGGRAFCWGTVGQPQRSLGDGKDQGSATPVPVSTAGVLAGLTVTEIDTAEHTCVIASNQPICWGQSRAGGGNLPYQVDDLGRLAGKTLTGSRGICLLADGAPWCLQSAPGNTDDGYFKYEYAPVDTAQFGDAAVTVMDGRAELCAVAGGQIRCTNQWEIGGDIPPLTALPHPGPLTGKNVTLLARGENAWCALANGKPYCWGAGAHLGNGLPTMFVPPQNISRAGALAGRTISMLDSSGDLSCAIADGEPWCWGWYPTFDGGSYDPDPAHALPFPADPHHVLGNRTITDLAVGENTACVVADGAVWCWSDDPGYPPLGTAAVRNSLGPVPVYASGALAGKTVTAVAVGLWHTCVIADAAPFCWGDNTSAQLGNRDAGPGSAVPVPVRADGALAGKAVTDITASRSRTCVLADGAPYCWGANSMGALGTNASFAFEPTPVDTTGALAGKSITDIAAGSENTCVLADGAPYCWGDSQGIGTAAAGGSSQSVTSPVAVDTTGVLTGRSSYSIDVGDGYACVAVRNVASPAAAGIACWGGNAAIAAATGDPGSRQPVPFAVDLSSASTEPPVFVVAGTEKTFAVTATTVSSPVTAGVVPVTPARIADSRFAQQIPAAVQGGSTTTVQVAGVGGVPATGATAAVLTVTAVEPGSWGYITVWPTGANRPNTSNANFMPGQTVATTTVARLGTNGAVSLYNGSSARSHLIVDVTGYITGDGAVTTAVPARVADSRSSFGIGRALDPDETVSLQVGGRGGVPLDATSAILTVTAVESGSIGYLSVWAAGLPDPGTSNLNFARWDATANTVITRLSPDGRIQIHNGSATTTQVIVDVTGYLPTKAGAGSVTLTQPSRVADSRTGLQIKSRLGQGSVSVVQLTGKGDVPTSKVTAVVLDVVAVAPTADGWLSVWPTGSPRTATSSLNFLPGRDVASTVIVPVGADGSIRIGNGGSASVDIVVDVFGYVTG